MKGKGKTKTEDELQLRYSSILGPCEFLAWGPVLSIFLCFLFLIHFLVLKLLSFWLVNHVPSIFPSFFVSCSYFIFSSWNYYPFGWSITYISCCLRIMYVTYRLLLPSPYPGICSPWTPFYTSMDFYKIKFGPFFMSQTSSLLNHFYV